MKNVIIVFLLSLVRVSSISAQTESSLTIKYMVTYDDTRKVFTAWLVPEYDTPNFNNPDTQEKGVTAQFSLKVPRGFSISSISDENGIWEKNPTKIGSQKEFSKVGIDAAFEYYIIGKGNSETNYGPFKKDEPVALFTFQGNGGDVSKVTILENDDPFVKLADKNFALNVQNSFYSRSGQSSQMTAKPLEQGAGSTSLKNILEVIAKQVSMNATIEPDQKVLAYPNPTADIVNLKYFVEQNDSDVNIELVNNIGNIQPLKKLKGSLGINTTQVNLKDFNTGSYFIKMIIEDKVYTQKVIKFE
jgi:Secretion system C-terminal sorting domain